MEQYSKANNNESPNSGFDPNLLDGIYYTCKLCNFKFTNKLKFRLHYILNHKLYYCTLCTFVFANCADKLLHEKQVHFPIKCEYCSLDFADYLVYKIHIRTIHAKQLCDLCVSNENLENFEKHLQQKHSVSSLDILSNINEKNCIFTINDYEKMGNSYYCLICAKHKKLENIFEHFIHYHNVCGHFFLDHTIQYSDVIKIDGSIDIDIDEFASKKCITKLNEKLIEPICGQCNNVIVDATDELHEIFCKGYKLCIICNKLFTNLRILNKHINTNHNAMNCKFGCKNMKFRFNEIQNHYLITHNITNNCKFCVTSLQNTFSHTNELEQHLKIIHKINITFFDKTWDKIKLYRCEGLIRKTKTIFCNLCNANITNLICNVVHLVEHYEIQHNIEITLIKLYLTKIQNLIPEIESKNIDDDENLLKKFSIINKSENDNATNNVNYNKNIEYNYDFNTNLVQCIAASEDDLSDDELENEIYDIKNRADLLKKYQCKFCDIKSIHIKSIRTLFLHMETYHGFQLQNISIECHICKIKFTRKINLQKHNKTKHNYDNKNQKNMLCPFCKQEFKNRWLLRQHINDHVETVSQPCLSQILGYSCRICCKLFWTMYQRNKHELAMHSNQIGKLAMMCIICAVPFSSMSCLRLHTSLVHPMEPQINYILFKCSICKITYIQLDDIRQHMNKVHPTEKSLYCNINTCRMQLKDAMDLHKHITDVHKNLTNIVKLYQCNLCKKTFKSKTNALIHYKRYHLANHHKQSIKKIGSLKCRLCKLSFVMKNNCKIIKQNRKNLIYCKKCSNKILNENMNNTVIASTSKALS